MTSNSRVASSTVRVIRPGVSRCLSSAAMPVRLTSPTVGRIPTRLLVEAGARTLPPVSVPTPNGAKVFRKGDAGSRTGPPPLAYAVRIPREAGGYGVHGIARPIDNSESDAFARMMAPAVRRRSTIKASRGGTKSLNNATPDVASGRRCRGCL
jgi:hypothetical protein